MGEKIIVNSFFFFVTSVVLLCGLLRGLEKLWAGRRNVRCRLGAVGAAAAAEEKHVQVIYEFCTFCSACRAACNIAVLFCRRVQFYGSPSYNSEPDLASCVGREKKSSTGHSSTLG